MNKLFIIGNGFDLAHGLKTSYTDFMLCYLKNAVAKLMPDGYYDDKLIRIDQRNAIREVHSISDFISLESGRTIIVGYKFLFLREIIYECIYRNWVDIEYKYYQALVKYYKRLEGSRPPTLQQIEIEVKGLNNCMNLLKQELQKYLLTICPTSKKDSINQHLQTELSNINRNHDQVIYLIFNYTNTIDLYSHLFNPADKKIYIHGSIKSTTIPMVFGYGDSSDPYYSKIKELNSNEFIDNFKIFGYLRSWDYQTLLTFLRNMSKYEAYIIGHSCGISDRLLLKSIFDNEHCHSIKLYHYKRPDGSDDYTEKTKEISRHCRLETEDSMMSKIVPFSPFNEF